MAKKMPNRVSAPEASHGRKPGQERFDQPAFAQHLDAAISRLEVLTPEQARQFVDKGYVVIEGAFSREIAAAVCACAWDELATRHGVAPDDPLTWDKPLQGPRMNGYVRTGGNEARINLARDAPRAFDSQLDVVGGAHRLPGQGHSLRWGYGAIGNLGIPGVAWEAPEAQQPGWHKDGWHFRHFLNSPEQGLIAVPLFSDILPRSGGTFIATDSIAPVARLLADHPEGIHGDSVQGGGYLVPGLIEQCHNFTELTGSAGDLVLLHPFILHRVSVNPTTRPRFIANAALVLSQPMQFAGNPDAPCSLVELAILQALQAAPFTFTQTQPAKAMKPSPFRNNSEATAEAELLAVEMGLMAEEGLTTPAWGPGCRYGSNNPAAVANAPD